MEKKHVRPRDYVNPNGETLVIRNLSSKLKRDDLADLFGNCGRVKGVRLGEENSGKAFVYMLKQRDAIRAIKQFHNRVIDGRKLQVSAK